MSMNPSRRGRRLMGEINVVPYIDVMLVLLIIFMVTAPLLTQGIKVDLPKAGAEPLPEDPKRKNEPLIMSVDRDGNFYLNFGGKDDTPVPEEELLQRVAAVLRREPTTAVLVKADKNVVATRRGRAGRLHYRSRRRASRQAPYLRRARE
jgi:biopolymer transport protein TolR